MEPNVSPKEQAVRIINAHILSNSEEIEDSASKMLDNKKVFKLPKNVPLNKIILSMISQLYDGLDQLSSEGRDKNTRYRNYLLSTIEIIDLLDSTLNNKYFASAAKLHDACLLSKHIEKYAKKVNVNSKFKQTTLSGDILPDHEICLADILAMEHSSNDGPLFSIPFTTIFDKSGKVSEDFTGIANILSQNGKLTPEMLEKLTLSKLE
mgnify:FL=1